MLLPAEFCQNLLTQQNLTELDLIITDNTALIVAATDRDLIGTHHRLAQHICQLGETVIIPLADAAHQTSDRLTCGLPCLHEDQLIAVVIASGPAHVAQVRAEKTCFALSSALMYAAYHETHQYTSATDEHIASRLLSKSTNADDLRSLMYQKEMDPALLRAVICIQFDFYRNDYFNINLNLGYEASIESARENLVRQIRQNQYLNSQDLVHLYDRNLLVVIKSFIPVSNLTRLYLSLDRISEDLIRVLEQDQSLSYKIAYGNLVPDVDKVHRSFQEALEVIELGQQSYPDQHYYALENVLFESVCSVLNPQIVSKLLEPAAQRLAEGGRHLAEVLETMEILVDQNLNTSATAAKTHLHRNTINQRLEKMRQIVGLDPTASFQDAFLIKMLAIHLRRQHRN